MGLGGLLKRAAARAFPERVLYRGRDRQPPRVALTFDDGPHPEHTPRIVGELASAGARATFFLQGAFAERRPDLVRAIHDAGHELGNHGWSHSRATDLGRRGFLREVNATQDLLERIVGRTLPRLFRPPYGSVSLTSIPGLLGGGFRLVFWSFDSRDSFVDSKEGLLAALRRAPLRGGEVLLFHEDYAHTAAALPEILAEIRARGLAMVGVSEL
jgi:peptidoglycan/xylan/chitin deacetylase (PgdA/CDA1 family)